MKLRLVLFILFLIGFFIFFLAFNKKVDKNAKSSTSIKSNASDINLLTIEDLRKSKYIGSNLIIEKELSHGGNYKKYIVSYLSGNLRIFGLLSIPNTANNVNKVPAIILDHGYVVSDEYKSDEPRYAPYFDFLAKNGYVVFKPDYRGFGNSDGYPESYYYSSGYLIDILNAVSSIERLPYVNSEKIGMWSHSKGGNLALRCLVVTQKIRASVIWAGVVGTYEDIYYNSREKVIAQLTQAPQDLDLSKTTLGVRGKLVEKYGKPNLHSSFWRSVDPYAFIKDINTPIQLHHGTADKTVPINFSIRLRDALKENKKVVEYFSYQDVDHIFYSPVFELAMRRSIDFFDKYLK